MPFVAVDISSGQVSTVGVASGATSLVRNMSVDAAGVNMVRPALVEYATTGLGSAALIGLYRWKTWMIGVDDSRDVWALSDAAPTAWTAITDGTATTRLDGASRPVFAEDASDLFIVGGGGILKWTGVGNCAQLGAGPQATHISNVGQRLIANDLSAPTRYYYSNAGDGSDATWGALSFITAEARPDPIVAIYDNTAEVFLFGETTLEVHGISSDALTPFQRIATLNLGCGAPYSPVRSDSLFSWLDNRRRLVTSDGRSYQWISEAIHSDIVGLSEVEDCFGFQEDTARGTSLVWVFPTAARTFVYDTTSKKWGERDYYDTPVRAAWPVTCHAFWPTENLNLVGASGVAGVYKLDTSVTSDLGGALVAERITGHVDFGTKSRKRSIEVMVTMRRGTAATTASQLELAIENDGKGFGTFKTRTIGIAGDYLQQVRFHFGGVFRRRRYWLRYSGADPIEIVSMDDNVIDLEAVA